MKAEPSRNFEGAKKGKAESRASSLRAQLGYSSVRVSPKMTSTEQLIAAVKTSNPNLSDEEIIQRLIDAGTIKRGYSIEPDTISKSSGNERTSFVNGFAVLKDGVVYCRKNTEFRAQKYLDDLRKADEVSEE